MELQQKLDTLQQELDASQRQEIRTETLKMGIFFDLQSKIKMLEQSSHSSKVCSLPAGQDETTQLHTSTHADNTDPSASATVTESEIKCYVLQRRVSELERLEAEWLLEKTNAVEVREQHVAMLRRNPPDRPAISTKRKLLKLMKQEFKCGACLEILNENNYDFDHKIRWCDSFDNTDHNLQALCLTCHRKKTKLESKPQAH